MASVSKMAVPWLKLLDGRSMPAFGLGVYLTKPGAETEQSVRWALQKGYPLVDTAALYKNEEDVGKALQESGLARDRVFLITKLWDDDHGYRETLAATERSLQNLGTKYVDLYLMHSPNQGKLVETWDAFLELQRRGLVKSIGVSNFGVQHLELLEQHGRPLPVVNQVEMHPLVYRSRLPLIDFCQQRGIVIQAYGSLFAGKTEWLKSPDVESIATDTGRTPAQVLLRWALQLGFALIPKSTKQERLDENLAIFDFELSESQMRSLCNMQGRLGRYWDPTHAKLDAGDTSHWIPSEDSARR